MSGDIVVRWRGRIPAYYSGPTMREAADEIERLRAEVVRLRAAGDALAEVAAQMGNHRLGRRQTNAAIATWQEVRRG